MSTTVGQVSSTPSHDPTCAELSDLNYTVGGTVLHHEHRDRDTLGRVSRVNETWPGVTTSWRYRYDAAGRLSHVLDAAGAQLRGFRVASH